MQSQLISRLTGIFDFLNKYDKSAPSPVSVKAEANTGVASTIVKAVANVVKNAVVTSPAEENKKEDKPSVAVAENVSTSPLVKGIVTAIATTISQASNTSADAQTAITPEDATLPIGTPSFASSPLGITSQASNPPEHEISAQIAPTIVAAVTNAVASSLENVVATSPVESKKGDKNSVAVAEQLSTSPLVKEIVTAIATTISQASNTSADAQTAITPEDATLPIGTPSFASSPLGITSQASNPPEHEISAQIAPTIVAAVTNAVASSLENETSTVSSHASNPSTKVAQPTSLTTNLENKLKYVFTYLEKYRKPSIGAPVATVQVAPSTSKIRIMNTLGSSEEQKPHSTVPLSFTGVTTTLVGEKDNKPTQTINTYDFSKK